MKTDGLRGANPKTIQDKVLVGYQGWFTCAGDGDPIHPGHHGWLHWFNSPIPSGGRPNTDFWPDTSEYDPSELYPAPGLAYPSGDPVYLFSSRHPKTVRRHFHWMALHGVDGAFLQRFATQCEIKRDMGIRNLRDEIGERVREAAEAEGRVFAIMYDVSGVSPDKIQNVLQQDWMHLLHDQRILDSPSYLREKDKPVVALWGFGFNGRNHTPELVRAITEFFRTATPGGVYLVAGTPGHWRTSSSDADRNPGFLQVWTECFDAISPWTVGRYRNEELADRWGEERIKADADYLRKLEEGGRRRVDYIPVVLPGGSGFNLSEGKWGMNDIIRNGGQFLWRQIYNARRAGVRTIYGAMWDEYDEGTAFIPVVSHASQLPVHPSFRFLALDVDGHDLPSDWYMRIVGFAAEAFHGERTLPSTFPHKELQDYWSTRPRRVGAGKEDDQKEVDVDQVTRAFREWEIAGANPRVSSDAPPPYSLEDEPAPPGQWSQSHQPPQQVHALPSGTGQASRPPVRQDTRPTPSHHSSLSGAVQTAAVPLAAAAAVHTLTSGTQRHSPSIPPAVSKLSHPSQRQTTGTGYHTKDPKEFVMAPPPLPHRPTSSPQPGSLDVGRPQPFASPLGPPPGHGIGHSPGPSVGMHHVHAHTAYSPPPLPPPGHAPHVGHLPTPSPHPTAVPALAIGHHPGEHGRGRPRSRSKSRSRSRSRSKSRLHHHQRKSRSRSSSRSRRLQLQAGLHHHHAHGSHSSSHGHGHGHHHGHHGHSLSPHSPAMFPGIGPLQHAYSDGAYGHGHGPASPGAYVPLHSDPIGHGAFPHTAPSPGFAPPPTGYGYQGYDGMHGPHIGYTPHPSTSPSPSSPYYPSYGPGPGPGPGMGAGRGGIQGSIASALQTVEGMTNRQTRERLEKTVNTFFNKLK